MADLHPLEITVLRALADAGGPISTDELASRAKIDKVAATRTSYFLSTKGLARLQETEQKNFKITEEGRTVAERGLPEKTMLRALKSKGNQTVSHLVAATGLDDVFVKISLGHLKKADLVGITRTPEGETAVSITETGVEFLSAPTPEEAALAAIAREEGPLPEQVAQILVHRHLAVAVERKQHVAEITEEGKALVDAGVKMKETSLTHEMLKSGAWKGMEFRAFDVGAPVAEPVAGKAHPLDSIISKVRRIFLQMGFTEERGPFVESSFWCFDALFQPQDHPAREMADTFYMKVPSAPAQVPESLLPRVKAAHEHGILGSRGWGGTWSEDVTRQLVLRTHTTAVSARSLAKYKPPAKIFTIDKVYRNETLDYKHLAELYQVEGIVFDESVNFRHLLGYLKEFYVNQMGFKRVRFRPAYFPYTEMSVEPEVFNEERGEWMELGGAGIFRPEVVQPLTGLECPVLAWGLGLDRLAMLKLGLQDIRANYQNDLGWLRQVALP